MRRIDPDCLPAYPTMSWAVESDGLLFLSGIVAIDRDGAVIGPGDAQVQADACLDIIVSILTEAGATTDDVVKLTCFATSREAARAYVASRAKRMPGRPAATSVIVDALLNPDIVLEIEVIARAPRAVTGPT